MPAPRDISHEEQTKLQSALLGRFVVTLPSELQYAAAGDFRFVRSRVFHYIDRTDLGSIAFEYVRYGDSNEALDPAAITEDMLLSRIETTLVRMDLKVRGAQFAGFQDEFAGAAQPAELPQDFDPRKNSLHVARTATFNRQELGVPIFDSELLVGLMSDGRIGRLRLHWPEIDPVMIADAQKLQELVRNQQWSMPEALKGPAIEILDISAGVGHSGFANPGFAAMPVVRILIRKTTKDTEHPLVSTRYTYFDVRGREVRFSNFLQIPGSSVEEKEEFPK
jgi:hypothetical protein